jgi:hypothetical protein
VKISSLPGRTRSRWARFKRQVLRSLDDFAPDPARTKPLDDRQRIHHRRPIPERFRIDATPRPAA